MAISVHAYHLGDRLDFGHVDVALENKVLRKDSTFRLFKISEDAFVYFKDFGAVVFVNVNEDEQKSTFRRLSFHDLSPERYFIEVSEIAVEREDFSNILIPEYNVDMLHITCLNVAQSLALDHYQKEVDLLLEKTRVMSAELERTGRIRYSRKYLAKLIGEIMSLRNRMADNLYIFEAPPLAWQDPELTKIDEMMSNRFDFSNRHKSIQNSVAVIKENHEFFNDLLQHKHSSLLEWIIIVLILFEVVHVLIK